MGTLTRRAGAVAAGLLVDRLFGEPPTKIHPVAAFGNAMTALEQRLWSDDRVHGAAYATIGISCGVAVGKLLPSTTLATALVVAGRQLRSIASEVGELAELEDLRPARHEIRSLVGRDPSELDSSGIAAAAIESVAENTVDSTFSAAFWAVVAGAPGAYGFRAINTMDAMVGHRSDRFENFGWAAAKVDDAANWLPARLFASAVLLRSTGNQQSIRRALRDDAPKHPSPNAGIAEAAMAGAINRQLGGPLQYGDRFENRPTLGDGPRPQPGDVQRSVDLVDEIEKGLVGLLVLVWLFGEQRSYRLRRRLF